MQNWVTINIMFRTIDGSFFNVINFNQINIYSLLTFYFPFFFRKFLLLFLKIFSCKLFLSWSKHWIFMESHFVFLSILCTYRLIYQCRSKEKCWVKIEYSINFLAKQNAKIKSKFFFSNFSVKHKFELLILFCCNSRKLLSV